MVWQYVFFKLHESKLNYISGAWSWLDLSFGDKIYGNENGWVYLDLMTIEKTPCKNRLIHSMIVLSSQINGFKLNSIWIDRSGWDL